MELGLGLGLGICPFSADIIKYSLYTPGGLLYTIMVHTAV